ncbi:uncharacterized protein LOC110106119 [Dendrobium catenatum]|uniref:uncharacterized protein LOC110106119 n=1 Tax=Dendrobium catenatum TaxID=906689 RepID=UPI0009F165D9|nr:uncharacterized protein LOC110106119 [Dendrobium catenatum]
MGDQESSSSLPPNSTTTTDMSNDLAIPLSLKFLISNIKNLIPHPLSPENYAIWRLQVSQNFSANGYSDHLTGKCLPPPDSTSVDSARWHLIDSHLISALFSTISPPLLPYVITAKTSQEVWMTLEHRLQSTSRSRVIQLKNELHHIQMNNLTMQQYLSQIKNIVDNIVAAGTKIDPEDVVLYTLNGLPPSYNSFKTAIRTSPLPADLKNLYSLLCSEEIHINQDLQKDHSALNATALYATSQNQSRNRYQKRFNKSKNPQPRQSDGSEAIPSPPRLLQLAQLAKSVARLATLPLTAGTGAISNSHPQ